MQENKQDRHIGEITGIFEIVERMPHKSSDGHALYKGICVECGYERIAKYSNLKETKKCTHVESTGNFIKHNLIWQNKRIKKIFNGMKQRCYNENCKDYQLYGVKGIKICDQWLDNPLSFEKWSLQNGYTDNLTIDRIDANKDYCPDNCRWIPREDNSRRAGNVNWITIDNQTMTVRQWSDYLEISANTINSYIRKYGLENTIEFIKKFMNNPYKGCNHNQSYYEMYMN